MDIERITEIGIAVEDLEQATRLFVEMLGATAGLSLRHAGRELHAF